MAGAGLVESEDEKCLFCKHYIPYEQPAKAISGFCKIHRISVDYDNNCKYWKEISKMESDSKVVDTINNLSQTEMARLIRFAPVGHEYFDMSKPYNEIFKKRFTELGGMTPAISKAID